jgi:hypothetical protein
MMRFWLGDGRHYSHGQKQTFRTSPRPRTMFYDFVRVHQTLKITPAMAAGVTKRLWEMNGIFDLINSWESRHMRQTRLGA